ncbi:MAG: hypothetical protein EZS28_012757 [Streblomastix strix]|uniref:Uncharacterized protein n=1 Tax=Streblomastix strix TaxID=222440 RepID=A0A5J4WA13_9EUKA|nr:MAG: hypothetical protein EZS28_012757 [Streblomastix strix]
MQQQAQQDPNAMVQQAQQLFDESDPNNVNPNDCKIPDDQLLAELQGIATGSVPLEYVPPQTSQGITPGQIRELGNMMPPPTAPQFYPQGPQYPPQGLQQQPIISQSSASNQQAAEIQQLKQMIQQLMQRDQVQPKVSEEQKKEKESFRRRRRKDRKFKEMTDQTKNVIFDQIKETMQELDEPIRLLKLHSDALTASNAVDAAVNGIIDKLREVRSSCDRSQKDVISKQKFGDKVMFKNETLKLVYPLINPKVWSPNHFKMVITEASLRKYEKETVLFRIRDGGDGKKYVGKMVKKGEILKNNQLAEEKSDSKYSIEYNMKKALKTIKGVTINWEEVYPIERPQPANIKDKKIPGQKPAPIEPPQLHQFSIDLLVQKKKDSYDVVASGSFCLDKLMDQDSCTFNLTLFETFERAPGAFSQMANLMREQAQDGMQDAEQEKEKEKEKKTKDKESKKKTSDSEQESDPLSVTLEVQIAHPFRGYRQEDKNIVFIIIQDVNDDIADLLDDLQDDVKTLVNYGKVGSMQQVIQPIPMTKPKVIQPQIPQTQHPVQPQIQSKPSTQPQPKVNPPLPQPKVNPPLPQPKVNPPLPQPKVNPPLPQPKVNPPLPQTKEIQQLKTTKTQAPPDVQPVAPPNVQPGALPVFDFLKAQSEIEYEGQDFAEVEKIIPIESLFPSSVLEREIKMVDNIQKQIKRDQTFANKYENLDLLNARKEKAQKYLDKGSKDYEEGLMTDEGILKQMKEMQIQQKSKMIEHRQIKTNTDLEKRRSDGITHHFLGVLMCIKEDIRQAENPDQS